MNTSLEHSSRHLNWLRFGLVAIALLGVITLLLMTNSEPAEAAPEVVLSANDL